jgi:hypothetical protein
MTPFKTNQQKQVETVRRVERDNALENMKKAKEHQMQANTEPLLEFKLNQPMQQQQIPQAQIYPSPYVPVPNPYYPYSTNMGIPWQYQPNNVPIIKKYNISLGGPNGDITKLANLYEDILPNEGNVSNNTFNTIKERIIIHRYIRSIFVKTGDGEELLINGGQNTSSEITNLLSHVKLLEINPYHYSKLTDNPYRTLPSNFIMYRSCYPVKMGAYNNVECSKSSIGMNVRIYLMSAYDAEIYTNQLDRHNSDIWRELDYYQYIRDEVIKTMMSPNFISIHSYYITKNTGINFKKFDTIRGNLELKNMNIEKMNNDLRNKLYLDQIIRDQIKDKKVIINFNDLLALGIVPPLTPFRQLISDNERNKAIEIKINNEVKKNTYNKVFDSDKCLVILSEAPTQQVFDWATRSYELSSGPIKKMLQSGYHDDKVWESLFFQLLIAMIIMFNKEIMFTEFSLKDNVFIKDLRHNDQNVGIWKYIFKGTEYYIPNYGYLLLIDSNYAELMNQTSGSDFKPRIQSTKMKDLNDKGQIYKLCLERMKEVFSSNNLKQNFTNYGGIAPSENFQKNLDIIIREIDKIYNTYFSNNYDKDNLIKDVNELPLKIIDGSFNFLNFIHSRVGTIVRENEKIYISVDFRDKTKNSLVVVNNKFGIYLKTNDVTVANPTVTNDVLISDKVITNYEDRSKIKFNIVAYSDGDIRNFYGSPDHMYEPGKQYNVLETYLISSSE